MSFLGAVGTVESLARAGWERAWKRMHSQHRTHPLGSGFSVCPPGPPLICAYEDHDHGCLAVGQNSWTEHYLLWSALLQKMLPETTGVCLRFI